MIKNFFVWVVIIMLLVGVFGMLQENKQTSGLPVIDYTSFLGRVESQQVQHVVIDGRRILGEAANGQNKFVTYNPGDNDVVTKLQNAGVQIEGTAPPKDGSPFTILLAWLPMLLFIGVYIFFMRKMQGGGGGGAMGFGRSRAKLLTENNKKVTFADVAGIDEAKQELEEVVDYLKDPLKFQRLGGKIPRGVLLVGPPGTGKTLLARAIAGEAAVPFFSISGSDFVEMFVGVGASRVRDMFEQGKKNAPCIIFIDEIDAVGRKRGGGASGGHEEREQTLNQLLVEMDGFEGNEGVIIIAATNRPDVLDQALLRPGRFDRQVTVPNPDVIGREKILKVHLKKVPLDEHVDVRSIARGTPGFSGAELANLVNEAALLAARKNLKMVGTLELEEAKDKVMMGSERRSMAMSEEEKKLTAYHEAGHAIVGLNCPNSDPIHKATIIPRGQALGMVMRLPEGDRYSHPFIKLKEDLAMTMGGRIAEEMIFGKDHITTGASSDIQQATRMARAMITEWGYSDKLGTVNYKKNDQSFQSTISDETTKEIDEEVRQLMEDANNTARQILTDKKDAFVKLAEALLEYETLTGEEINNLINGNGVGREPYTKRKIKKKEAVSSVPALN